MAWASRNGFIGTAGIELARLDGGTRFRMLGLVGVRGSIDSLHSCDRRTAHHGRLRFFLLKTLADLTSEYGHGAPQYVAVWGEGARVIGHLLTPPIQPPAVFIAFT